MGLQCWNVNNRNKSGFLRGKTYKNKNSDVESINKVYKVNCIGYQVSFKKKAIEYTLKFHRVNGAKRALEDT